MKLERVKQLVEKLNDISCEFDCERDQETSLNNDIEADVDYGIAVRIDELVTVIEDAYNIKVEF